MEAPEAIVTGLRNIRPTFSLVLNPRGRVIGERSFDVNGHPREVTWDPRWELWDRDADGIAYKVMTLEDAETRGYLPPDQRFLDFVNLINPERYGGNVEKVIQALVDDANEYVKHLAQKDFESLTDSLSNYFTPAKGRGMVAT